MPEGESQFSRKICAIHLIFHMLKYGIGTAMQWRLMGSLKVIIFKNHHSLEQISRHPGQRSMIQDTSIFFFFFFFYSCSHGKKMAYSNSNFFAKRNSNSSNIVVTSHSYLFQAWCRGCMTLCSGDKFIKQLLHRFLDKTRVWDKE